MNDSTHDDHDDHDGGESISLVQAKHLAPGLGRQARNLFRSRYRIQPTGPVHEPGACEGPADPDALAEALGGYRLAMTPGRLEHAAGSARDERRFEAMMLGVGAELKRKAWTEALNLARAN